jgi:hypothetical protein
MAVRSTADQRAADDFILSAERAGETPPPTG